MGISWHDRFEELRQVMAAVDYHEDALRAAHVADDSVAVMEAEREWNEYRALASRLLREAFDALETARDCTADDLEARLRELRPAPAFTPPPRIFWQELSIAVGILVVVVFAVSMAFR